MTYGKDKASICLLNDAFELIKHININNFKSTGLDETSITNKNSIEQILKDVKNYVDYDVLINYIELFFKYLYFFCILNQYYQYYHENSNTKDYEKRQMLANAVENFLKHYKDLKDDIKKYKFSYDTIPILEIILKEATSLHNKYFDIDKKDTLDYLGHQKTLQYIGYKESTKYENNLITRKPNPVENSSDKNEPYIEGSATIIGYDNPRTRNIDKSRYIENIDDYRDDFGFKGYDGGYRKKSRRLARKTKRTKKSRKTKRRKY